MQSITDYKPYIHKEVILKPQDPLTLFAHSKHLKPESHWLHRILQTILQIVSWTITRKQIKGRKHLELQYTRNPIDQLLNHSTAQKQSG